MKYLSIKSVFISLFIYTACSSHDDVAEQDPVLEDNCNSNQMLDASRGACNETLRFTSEYSLTETITTITINSNSIPNHNVGLFG
ncbi:hypothetical protein [Urechidicola sp. KH5]